MTAGTGGSAHTRSLQPYDGRGTRRVKQPRLFPGRDVLTWKSATRRCPDKTRTATPPPGRCQQKKKKKKEKKEKKCRPEECPALCRPREKPIPWGLIEPLTGPAIRPA
ncbi:hypothetical protein HPB50_021438 [Hyalomma asiaticum]|uniref:Uncharacterized protein n=1 Tax=Hyalomma asiaticum TaxID=266040 RepID=A0ACB7TLE9_HYAAI|nr:hypothetical protein HPB50_021438 [Hyalomma asiaticum]